MLSLPKTMSLLLLTLALAAAWPTGAFADWWNWHYHYPSSSYYVHGYPTALDLVAEAAATWPVEPRRAGASASRDLVVSNPLGIEVTYQIRSRYSAWYTHTRSLESRQAIYTARPDLFLKLGEGPQQRSYTLVGGRTYNFKRAADDTLELEDAGPMAEQRTP